MIAVGREKLNMRQYLVLLGNTSVAHAAAVLWALVSGVLGHMVSATR